MNNQDIFDLMARFDVGTATKMKLSVGNFSLELERGGTAPCSTPSPLPSAPADHPVPQGSFITAPLVGTFYVASEPGADPFVQPGQKVKKGQTVGLLEAMKMMSEVQAPRDCVIEEILAQDGALVSFGEALIRYREG